MDHPARSTLPALSLALAGTFGAALQWLLGALPTPEDPGHELECYAEVRQLVKAHEELDWRRAFAKVLLAILLGLLATAVLLIFLVTSVAGSAWAAFRHFIKHLSDPEYQSLYEEVLKQKWRKGGVPSLTCRGHGVLA